jgi:hypothetical protein
MKRKMPVIIIPVLVVLIGAGAIFYNSWVESGGQGFWTNWTNRDVVQTEPPNLDRDGVSASSWGLINNSMISLTYNGEEGFDNFIVDVEKNIVVINARVMEQDLATTEGEGAELLVPANRVQMTLSGDIPVVYQDASGERKTANLLTYAGTVEDVAGSFWVHVENDRVVMLREVVDAEVENEEVEAEE